MADHRDEILRLLEKMESLTEQLKLLHLNLAVAAAKMRLEESTLQMAAAPMGRLADTASASYEQAAMLLRKAKGEVSSVEAASLPEIDLNYYLDKIEKLSEEIIRLVMSVKKGLRLNQEYEA